MEIHPEDLPDAAGDDIHAAAIRVDAADLRMPVRRLADIARCSDLEIKLIVGAERQIFPTMRLVAWQVIIDDDGFWRIFEVVLDLLDLQNFVELGDVQRAVLEREAIGRSSPEYSGFTSFWHLSGSPRSQTRDGGGYLHRATI